MNLTLPGKDGGIGISCKENSVGKEGNKVFYEKMQSIWVWLEWRGI